MRFRPKTREELENELQALGQNFQRTVEKLKQDNQRNAAAAKEEKPNESEEEEEEDDAKEEKDAANLANNRDAAAGEFFVRFCHSGRIISNVVRRQMKLCTRSWSSFGPRWPPRR